MTTITAPKTFTLTPEILDKLSEMVTFENDAALNQFLADAVNSYMQLGRLYQSGGQFHFLAEGGDGPVVLHFPFQPDPRTNNA